MRSQASRVSTIPCSSRDPSFLRLADPLVHGARNSQSQSGGPLVLSKLHTAGRDPRHCSALAQLIRQFMRCQQPRQLFLYGLLNQGPVQRCNRQAFQNQPVDVYVKFHATPPDSPCRRNSSSLTTRPSLRNSVRAASSTRSIVTGLPECAARNAALSAVL